MPEFHNLIKLAAAIGAYILNQLGGTVRFSDNKEEKYILLTWKKYDELTKEISRFEHKILYTELESMENAETYAQVIINEYKKEKDNAR